MPDILNRAATELERSGRSTGPRQAHAQRWWKFWRARSAMVASLESRRRYVACGRVTKRPIFVFLPAKVLPNDLIQVFAFDDDYSFGVLQSGPHWDWFVERCSTLKGDWRYTSTSVYNSFPWPQSPSAGQVKDVAEAARDLRSIRAKLLRDHRLSLRELYRSLELPGEHPLKKAHAELDEAVRAAYGMTKGAENVDFLFALNQQLATLEADGVTARAIRST